MPTLLLFVLRPAESPRLSPVCVCACVCPLPRPVNCCPGAALETLSSSSGCLVDKPRFSSVSSSTRRSEGSNCRCLALPLPPPPTSSSSTRSRSTAVQQVLRLRARRDHACFHVREGEGREGHARALARAQQHIHVLPSPPPTTLWSPVLLLLTCSPVPPAPLPLTLHGTCALVLARTLYSNTTQHRKRLLPFSRLANGLLHPVSPSLSVGVTTFLFILTLPTAMAVFSACPLQPLLSVRAFVFIAPFQ